VSISVRIPCGGWLISNSGKLRRMFATLLGASLMRVDEVDLSGVFVEGCLSNVFVDVCFLDNSQDLVKSLEFGHLLVSEVLDVYFDPCNNVSSKLGVLSASLLLWFLFSS
jgi:hypothetical protein